MGSISQPYGGIIIRSICFHLVTVLHTRLNHIFYGGGDHFNNKNTTLGLHRFAQGSGKYRFYHMFLFSLDCIGKDTLIEQIRYLFILRIWITSYNIH